MKRVLITGDNSYIGQSVMKWLKIRPREYEVSICSVLNDAWREIDFTQFDTVFHVAEIEDEVETRKNKDKFAEKSYELLVKIADHAKQSGVEHFVFLSTMAVFGLELGVITLETPTNPKTAFAKSKLRSEEYLHSIETESFKVAVVRPPMVYGYGSTGNYHRLSKFAQTARIFPDYKNRRSMLHIDNLCEFLDFIFHFASTGTFHPQNHEYARTGSVALKIAFIHDKPLRLTSFFDPIIKLLLGRVRTIDRAFGTLIYTPEMSRIEIDYQIRRFEESIERSEKEIAIDYEYWPRQYGDY